MHCDESGTANIPDCVGENVNLHNGCSNGVHAPQKYGQIQLKPENSGAGQEISQ